MDKEKIKDVLDSFENDKFTDAKDVLSQEIRSRRDEFLKGKLDLKGDIGKGSGDDADKGKE